MIGSRGAEEIGTRVESSNGAGDKRETGEAGVGKGACAEAKIFTWAIHAKT